MEKEKIKFVFFGTPRFAEIVLDELEKKNLIPDLIITSPDRPVGRGLNLTPPLVKLWAQERNIPIHQPEKLEAKSLKLEAEWQLFVVASYGKILPKWLLEIPQHGTLNVHPSLLPKLRGASPIESAILEENKTGVTIMQMDEEMDHGPIVSKKEVMSWKPKNPPNFTKLETLLAHEGGSLLAQIIPDWVLGKIQAKPQNHSEATFTKKIKKEDGLIRLSDNPTENLRKIRAFEKWPGAYFLHTKSGREIRVKITEAETQNDELKIRGVIPEGSRKMSWEEFLRGYRDPIVK